MEWANTPPFQIPITCRQMIFPLPCNHFQTETTTLLSLLFVPEVRTGFYPTGKCRTNEIRWPILTSICGKYHFVDRSKVRRTDSFALDTEGNSSKWQWQQTIWLSPTLWCDSRTTSGGQLPNIETIQPEGHVFESFIRKVGESSSGYCR